MITYKLNAKNLFVDKLSCIILVIFFTNFDTGFSKKDGLVTRIGRTLQNKLRLLSKYRNYVKLNNF